MNGKLYKSESGDWLVVIKNKNGLGAIFPLHPRDVKQIEKDGLVFDNIEARIKAYPDVEFFPIIDANINTTTQWAQLIIEPDTIEVSKADMKIFLDAIENPAEPNDYLKEAIQKYKTKLK